MRRRRSGGGRRSGRRGPGCHGCLAHRRQRRVARPPTPGHYRRRSASGNENHTVLPGGSRRISMPQASARMRTMCRPRPCGASGDLVLRGGEPGGAVGDLDADDGDRRAPPRCDLELGRGVLHGVGRQLRQHQHERVRLAVAGAGQLGEQEAPGLARPTTVVAGNAARG